MMLPLKLSGKHDSIMLLSIAEWSSPACNVYHSKPFTPQ